MEAATQHISLIALSASMRVFTLENICARSRDTLARGLQAGREPTVTVPSSREGLAMWSMPKRAESRTRTLRIDNQEWRVEERTDRVADRDERYLVFSSNGESLVLRDYHWLWFSFMDEELAALCRSRRKVRELVASH